MERSNNSEFSISFIIPVYRSEKTLRDVVENIAELNLKDWEVILINDNSPDGVASVVNSLVRKYPRNVFGYEHRKNCGQQASVIDGMKYVSKEYVATIDDDGQNPPEDIPGLVRKLINENNDVVYGAFLDKKHSSIRRTLSLLNRSITNFTIGNKKKIPITNVRVMKSYIARGIAQSSSMDNYIDGLIFSLTDHVGFNYVHHRNRVDGKSTYTPYKLLKLMINHIIGYSNFLIRVVTYGAVIISFIAFTVGCVYLMVSVTNNNRPPGWLSTYLTMTFLFSGSFFVLSIISEYLSRIYQKSNQISQNILCKVDATSPSGD